MSLGRSRLHLKRARDEAHRLGVIAATALENAEHLQRIEPLLVRRQHLIEQELGLAEGSGAVRVHRALQDLVHVHGGS
jgi:Mn-dependent DtxR family transcriptional regulator